MASSTSTFRTHSPSKTSLKIRNSANIAKIRKIIFPRLKKGRNVGKTQQKMIVFFYRDPSFLRTVPQPTSDVRFAGLHPAGFPPLAARARSLPLCAPALPSKRGKALGRSLRREEYRGNHGQTTGTELFPRPLLRQKSIRGGG